MKLIPGTDWFSGDSIPKDGSAFLFCTVGPQVDIGWWDIKDKCLRDYYHKQKIIYIAGWQPLPKGIRFRVIEEYTDLSKE